MRVRRNFGLSYRNSKNSLWLLSPSAHLGPPTFVESLRISERVRGFSHLYYSATHLMPKGSCGLLSYPVLGEFWVPSPPGVTGESQKSFSPYQVTGQVCREIRVPKGTGDEEEVQGENKGGREQGRCPAKGSTGALRPAPLLLPTPHH